MSDQLGKILASLGAHWYHAKAPIAHATSFSFDTLHVVVGILIQLIAAAILRTSVRSWRPWLVVFAFQLANEWNDLLMEVWPDRSAQVAEGIKDIVLTMLLPTVLLFVSRRFPDLLVKRP